ncbi:MAG: hypothetical protein ABIN36_10985 [Ferruginibacter sp.]
MKWFLFLPILFLLSCSSFDGLPTEEMALNKVKSDINEVTNECIEILELKKTNGVKQSVFGQDTYKFYYTIKYKFKQNSFQPFLNQGSLYYYTDKEYKIGLKHLNSPSDYLRFKKGYEIQKEDIVLFEKTENGWK